MDKKEISKFAFRTVGIYITIVNIIGLLCKLIILPPLVKSSMYLSIFIHLLPYIVMVMIGGLLWIFYYKLTRNSISEMTYAKLSNIAIGLFLIVNSIYLTINLISQNLTSYYSLKSVLAENIISNKVLGNTIILFGYQLLLYTIELAIGLFVFYKKAANSSIEAN